MAFCSKCGAQLEGNERFCVKCGHDVKANGAAAVPVAAAVPAASVPVPVSPPAAAAQAVAPPPQGYAAPPPYPGQPPIPVIMGPPPAQPKHRGWIWAVIIVAVLGGLYYIGTHNQQTPAGTAPAQPGGNPAQPGGQQPGGAPAQPGGQQPGGAPAQPGNNAALAKQQSFTNGQPYTSNGYLEIPSGKWINNSNVSIQSATLECDQNDSSGNVLAEMRDTLTGPNNAPVQPGTTVTFNTLQMGSVANSTSRVVCAIVHVKPAS
ncbi:MAG: zinc ribbon domain-containing protein [Terracidiphilus sp.]